MKSESNVDRRQDFTRPIDGELYSLIDPCSAFVCCVWLAFVVVVVVVIGKASF